MTERQEDDVMLRRARRLFREQESAMGPETRQALAAARRRALEAAGRPRPRRVSVLGPALAAMLVMAVWFWPGHAPEPRLEASATPVDLELVFSAEEWELIDDLDFFLLLAELDEDSGRG
jgi:hypothetical protein